VTNTARFPTLLTDDERRRMAVAAASITQLAEWWDEGSIHASRDPRAAEEAMHALRAWLQAFSPKDPEAFDRRLGWDELTRAHALELLSPGLEPDAAFVIPVWLEWIDRVLAEVHLRSSPLGDGGREGWMAAGDPLPFVELLAPMVRAGAAVLAQRAGARALAGATPDAHGALRAQLARELARVTELALYQRFRTHLTDRVLEAAPAPADDPYADWIRQMLTGGLASLLSEYPVLARQLATVLDGWVDASADLLRRLDADRTVIEQTFAGGAAIGVAVDVDPALSDPHDGRRRVARVRFESGLQIVYKPREVELESRFSAFLGWLAEQGLSPAHTMIRVLSRGEYGWVECAVRAPLADARSANRYFWQCGSLLAVAHLLRGRDLHMENLIATEAGPALIDLELLFEPPVGPVAAEDEDVAGGGCRVEDTCLSTGLVSFIESGADGTLFDVGALRGGGQGTAALAQRRWKDLASAALHFVEERTFRVRADNRATLGGDVLEPEVFAGAMLAGFADTYRLLLSKREALLNPEGPLMAFAGLTTRVIPRATNQYGLLLHVLNQPRYQARGVKRSAAMDVLHRVFAGAPQRPPAWDLVRAERRALEEMDIPLFSIRTDDTRVTANGAVVLPDHFDRPGLDAVVERLNGLSETDLDRQLSAIERALAASVTSRYGARLDDAPATPEDDLLAFARWIAMELVERRGAETLDLHPPGGGARACHLYDGSLGPALFLAALWSVTGESSWRDAAHQALATVTRQLDTAELAPDEPIGGCSGIASIVYGLALTGLLLDDPGAGETARRWRDHVTRERILRDRILDVVGGAAGCIMALLAARSVVGDDGVLALAAACGDHLLATALPTGQGWAWPAADGRLYVGFAHGAAGIGAALARLASDTGEERFAAAAERAFAFVEAEYMPARRNWNLAANPAAGAAPARAMTAWCHGAPGIALAMAAVGPILPIAGDRLDTARETTAQAPAHKADHVCCGNFGRVDALLTVGRLCHASEALDAAVRLVQQSCLRARRRGHFRLSASPFEYSIYDPSFFRGLSGIGYQLLRLRTPDRLPSIAALEAIG
jgi:type 2 lantibiotic biosynthesis protein LanM